MKNRKVLGSDGIPVEVWKILESCGVGWLTRFFNKILVERKIPDAEKELYNTNI